jgi:hypothetical protein
MARVISQEPKRSQIVIELTENSDCYYARCVAINGCAGNARPSKAETVGEAVELAITSSMARILGTDPRTPASEEPAPQK